MVFSETDLNCETSGISVQMTFINQTWWLHQMETFSMLLAICAGNWPVTGEFPSQRPVTWSFDVYFDLCLNKRLSKQWWGWWFVMPLRSLWHDCNIWGTLWLSTWCQDSIDQVQVRCKIFKCWSHRYTELKFCHHCACRCPEGCFTTISRALQNNITKKPNTKNHIYAENFKLKLCMCAQSKLWAHVQIFSLKFS